MTTKAADVAPGAQKKLKGILDKLEKQHGPLKMMTELPPLEQSIYLILREGSDFKKAQKALEILGKEYVEWNELRVATPKEIVAVLKGCGLVDLDDKVSRILALLSRLFYDFHKKDLDFVKIFESGQRQKIMLSFTPLGPPIIYVLLQWFENTSEQPQGLVVSMDAMNKIADLGLAKKTSSLNVAQKALSKLVAEEDYYRFQYLIYRT